MTDLEIMGDWYIHKYFRDLQKGFEPVAEDHDYIYEALNQWEKDDDPVIEEMEELERRKDNASEWDEVKL